MIPIKRSCDVENLADFARYYQGAWVGWHGDKEEITPCLVNRLLTADDIQLRPLSKDGYIQTAFAANLEKLKERIDFGLPDIGMVVDGPTVVFSSYMTPRTPKKGYRSRDLAVHPFNHWRIKTKYSQRFGVDRFDFTWFAFNPEYKTLEQANAELSEGKAVGIPVSRTLALYTMPEFKHSLLAYKRWTVGFVDPRNIVHLKPEYADYENDILKQTGSKVLVG